MNINLLPKEYNRCVYCGKFVTKEEVLACTALHFNLFAFKFPDKAEKIERDFMCGRKYKGK